ncbi:MAG: hypothetical protein K2Q45_06785 [Nitrosomonas sp.]|nr:hypothetical protein [Nitrosomonas sp.]
MSSKGVSIFKGGPPAWTDPKLLQPRFEEDDPKQFAAFLYQTWHRLPEPVQQRITNVLISPFAGTSKAFDYLEYKDSYTIMMQICNDNAVTKTQLRQIKDLVLSAEQLSLSQQRMFVLKLYVTYQNQFSTEQREMLAGILAHMVPSREAFAGSPDRVIASAIVNGADFEAFQFFIDFLKITLAFNKGKNI